jgi:hypothetical protein
MHGIAKDLPSHLQKRPLELGLVSFKGVDLSNVEFHNVKWLEPQKLLVPRYIIIDELLVDENKNYQEVSYIYNQLRKNYESKIFFDEASSFFIGEMEAKRKSLLHSTQNTKKIASVPYSLYKVLALYGESASLPLLISRSSVKLEAVIKKSRVESSSRISVALNNGNIPFIITNWSSNKSEMLVANLPLISKSVIDSSIRCFIRIVSARRFLLTKATKTVVDGSSFGSSVKEHDSINATSNPSF